MSFLNSLDGTEREAFISVAREHAFPRGARLMAEGEPANYVIVILSGWTQVTVSKNGSERVIAERGPGQLVGERGALEVNVRSASVTALGPVRALFMSTEDFTSFVDAHPRVLDLVQDQIYGRLIEERPAQGQTAPPPQTPAVRVHQALAGEARRPLEGENCTVLRTDVVEFGAKHRDDHDRRIIRLASHDMMRRTLSESWAECGVEDRGDGLLIVAPPHIPTSRITSALNRRLPDELRQHNKTYGEAVQFRLRVAVNVGPVMADDIGVSGEAIIRTARLIDCPAIKKSMSQTGAALGIIVSEFVYESAIRHSRDWIDDGEYKMVRVHLKELHVPGWLRLVDVPAAGRVTL